MKHFLSVEAPPVKWAPVILVVMVGLGCFWFAARMLSQDRAQRRNSVFKPRPLGPGERVVLWVSSTGILFFGYLIAFCTWISEAPD